MKGTLKGDLKGTFKGDLKGYLKGDLKGYLKGYLKGTLKASDLRRGGGEVGRQDLRWTLGVPSRVPSNEGVGPILPS